MSRWDALKPDRCNKQSKYQQRSRRWSQVLSRLREATSKDAVDPLINELRKLLSTDEPGPGSLGDTFIVVLDKSHNNDGLELIHQMLCKTKVRPLLGGDNIRFCFRRLAGLSPCAAKVRCLAQFTLLFHKELAPEETVQLAVKGCFLPALEDDSSLTSFSVDTTDTVLQALACLVSNARHIPALLLPLTLDISAEGQEQREPNPVGTRVVSALQRNLPKATMDLTNTVHAIRKANIGEPLLLPLMPDIFRLEQYFHETLKGGTDARNLRLLDAILHTFPPNCLQPLRTLLVNESGHKPECSGRALDCCSYTLDGPPLLDILHDGLCSTAIGCVDRLIRTLPWGSWRQSSAKGSLLFFQHRVEDALNQLITVLKCISERRELPPGVGTLCESVLTTFPFEHARTNRVVASAQGLLTSLSHRVMQRDTRGREGKQLVDCLVTCMGGQPRPQGGTTSMAVPMRLWLLRTSSATFREYLWSSCAQRASNVDNETLLFGALIFNKPDMAVARWSDFERLILCGGTSPVSRLNLLQKYVSGSRRKDEENESRGRFIVNTVVDAVQQPDSPQVVVAALGLYEAFVAAIWKVAIEDKTVDHLALIFKQCTAANPSIRVAALRAVAEACTQCLRDSCAQPFDELKAFCGRASDVASSGMMCSKANVKSTAIFAAGNLARAILREHKESEEALISSENFRELRRLSLVLLRDENDKVVGNTIRAIGQFARLTYTEPFRLLYSSDGHDENFFFDVVSSLLLVLVTAVQDARGQVAGRSWKQRSTTKKHAWGACSTVGVFLSTDLVRDNREVSKMAFRQLVDCLEPALALNHKICRGAVDSLANLPYQNLQLLSGSSGVVGVALAHCMKSSPELLAQDISEELTKKLCRALTKADANALVQTLEDDDSMLLRVYQKMCDVGVPANAAEAMAMALVEQHDPKYVVWHQRFISRAHQLSRESRTDTCELEDEL